MTTGVPIAERAIKTLSQYWPVSLESVTTILDDVARGTEAEAYTAIAEALLRVGELSAAALVNKLAMVRIDEVLKRLAEQKAELR